MHAYSVFAYVGFGVFLVLAERRCEAFASPPSTRLERRNLCSPSLDLVALCKHQRSSFQKRIGKGKTLLSLSPSGTQAVVAAVSRFKWVALFLAIWFGFPQPSLKYEKDVLPLARQWANSLSPNEPLKGVTAVITGSASGIGRGLTKQLANLGATVVALDRSMEGLKSLQEELPGRDLVPIEVHLDDLESVKSASELIRQKYNSIDCLVNCAGTNYFKQGPQSLTTSQNIDISFGVNYLSHFLLTETMIPLLMKSKFHPTIIQVTSSFHWAINGRDLVRQGDNIMPLAAQPKGATGIKFRSMRAYANSKLAQIMHARAIQRRRPNIRVKSICPGWVSTPIIGGPFQAIVLRPFAFQNEGFGIKSALYGIFQLNPRYIGEKNDFVTNTGMSGVIHGLPKFLWHPFAGVLRIRDVVSLLYAFVMLQTQRFTPFIKARKSSPESYNEDNQEDLYAWSYETVQPYL